MTTSCEDECLFILSKKQNKNEIKWILQKKKWKRFGLDHIRSKSSNVKIPTQTDSMMKIAIGGSFTQVGQLSTISAATETIIVMKMIAAITLAYWIVCFILILCFYVFMIF